VVKVLRKSRSFIYASLTLFPLIVDFALTIQFLEPETERTEIRIGGKFHFQAMGKDWQLSAESNPTELGPVFAIISKTVESAQAFKDRRLEITFIDDGGRHRSQACIGEYA
jgi:hypothetical protein